MPKVKGKHYPYTKAGYAAANKARRGYWPGGAVTDETKLRNVVSAEVFKILQGTLKPRKPRKPRKK